ncbi:uncharacterized protein LOC117115288 [Anneissia japonica]|uniref:uncharacterized protein LOC117115288 n=1 Tax=Anneissia japonica TaxID=1529436 RepID=UPI0014254E4C|nr:uncharacterized protein LOC117115288 [Anneissia japonica]
MDECVPPFFRSKADWRIFHRSSKIFRWLSTNHTERYGTKNTHVPYVIYRFFRKVDNDPMAGDLSHLSGASTANQRIEYLLSFLRRHCTEYWIFFFRDMLDEGYFLGGFLDVNLIHFCYMHLIQDGLDDMVSTLNHHLIRSSRNSRSSFGRPNIIYYMPEMYGTLDYICQVSNEQVGLCQQECTFRKANPCDKDVYTCAVY